MAIPVIPLVLLGVGVFVFSRRKRSSKKTGDETALKLIPVKAVFIPPEDRAPSDPSGAPGQRCEPKDGEGAWDDLGLCKTFWIDGDTDDAIRRLAREEWEARGRPASSEMCLAVSDPLSGELGTYKDNPLFTEIVAAALGRYYDVGPVFPPAAQEFNKPVSPYWVQQAWARATAVVRKELCES